MSVWPSSALKHALTIEISVRKIAIQNASSQVFNAKKTARLSINNAFQWRVVRNAGSIDITAWMDALLIIMSSAKKIVSSIMISVRQNSVLKHALDTGNSAQIAAILKE